MSDCIEWHKYVAPNGYGHTHVRGRTEMAHRAAMIELHVPIAGMVVMHRCDNRSCVNPDHLTVGTPADNNADMVAKQRQAQGTDINSCVLTPEQVAAIRQDWRPQRAIARDYKVAQTTVSKIKRGASWKGLMTS